jgi:hypothetical protein
VNGVMHTLRSGSVPAIVSEDFRYARVALGMETGTDAADTTACLSKWNGLRPSYRENLKRVLVQRVSNRAFYGRQGRPIHVPTEVPTEEGRSSVEQELERLGPLNRNTGKGRLWLAIQTDRERAGRGKFLHLKKEDVLNTRRVVQRGVIFTRHGVELGVCRLAHIAAFALKLKKTTTRKEYLSYHWKDKAFEKFVKDAETSKQQTQDPSKRKKRKKGTNPRKNQGRSKRQKRSSSSDSSSYSGSSSDSSSDSGSSSDSSSDSGSDSESD